MKYKTKRDSFFIYLWLTLILFVNAVFLIMLLLDKPSTADLVKVLIVDLFMTASLIWLAIDISYHIKDRYLLVKCGIFRSKIKYEDITKITGNPNIWVGYRALFSRDAIEIHYKTGLLGSVIISPVRKMEFIEQLVQRNNRIKVDL